MDLSVITAILKKSDIQLNEMIESMSKPGYDANSLAFKGRLINFFKMDQAFKSELHSIITEHFTNVKTSDGRVAIALKIPEITPNPFGPPSTSIEKKIEDVVHRDENNNIPITAADSRIGHDDVGVEIKSVKGMVDESEIKNISREFNKKK